MHLRPGCYKDAVHILVVSFLECLTMDIHKAIYASNYDSCGSACFETELEGCIEGSFTPFTVERTVKTATGLGSADGMALKRVHVPVTPEIVAKAKKFGIDLSQVDVLTVLVPPIIATKFDGNYSILGGPVMKSLGVGYDQSGWCHNPDFLIWHKAMDIRTELGHKRNGLPYLLLVPDKIVQERNLRSVHAHTLTPYRASLSLRKSKFLKLRLLLARIWSFG